LPTTGDNALYYHRNQQYSIVGLTNAAGTLVERYTYSAYGTLGIYAANGTVRSSSTYANRYTYTGREWDAELNLYHFRARWYDPATGGFVSRDPLGYVDGMSLYRGYFGVRGVDPSGKLLIQDGKRKPVGSELIGRDDKGRPIIKIHSIVLPNDYGSYARMGFSPGDCFVWDPETKTRIRIECPGRVVPGGVRRGKACAVVLFDHGQTRQPNWESQARQIALMDHLLNVGSRQQIIDFLRGRNCCSLYIIGHQGGDIHPPYGQPNFGGAVAYPDIQDPKKPVIILPTLDSEGVSREGSFEAELEENLDCAEGCAINLMSCGEDRIENFLTRQKIADRTGCTVCGSNKTISPGGEQFVDPPTPQPDVAGFDRRNAEQWMPNCNDPTPDLKR
jgi:RHS repeat-associated protein